MSVLQVEMGEMPLEIRRAQLAITYWANLKGHTENQPTQVMLQPYQEREKRQAKSFGWTIGNLVKELEMEDIDVSPTVPISNVPHWVLKEARVDLHLLGMSQYRKGKSINENVVYKYIEEKYSG